MFATTENIKTQIIVGTERIRDIAVLMIFTRYLFERFSEAAIPKKKASTTPNTVVKRARLKLTKREKNISA